MDGQNALQILLLIGGLTLVPAMLLCVTGFTRILIVLGFIRSGWARTPRHRTWCSSASRSS